MLNSKVNNSQSQTFYALFTIFILNRMTTQGVMCSFEGIVQMIAGAVGIFVFFENKLMFSMTFSSIFLMQYVDIHQMKKTTLQPSTKQDVSSSYW